MHVLCMYVLTCTCTSVYMRVRMYVHAHMGRTYIAPGGCLQAHFLFVRVSRHTSFLFVFPGTLPFCSCAQMRVRVCMFSCMSVVCAHVSVYTCILQLSCPILSKLSIMLPLQHRSSGRNDMHACLYFAYIIKYPFYIRKTVSKCMHIHTTYQSSFERNQDIVTHALREDGFLENTWS